MVTSKTTMEAELGVENVATDTDALDQEEIAVNRKPFVRSGRIFCAW